MRWPLSQSGDHGSILIAERCFKAVNPFVD
jgi:hypothetical protein